MTTTGTVTLVPSIQAASHGFVGATTVRRGGPRLHRNRGNGTYQPRAVLEPRVRSKHYIQFGVATSIATATARHRIRHPRQPPRHRPTNTHIYFRRYLPAAWRLTLEVVNEHGNGDDGLVECVGQERRCRLEPMVRARRGGSPRELHARPAGARRGGRQVLAGR